MKKVIMIVFVSLLISTVFSAPIFAGSIKAGLKGGANLAKLFGDDVEEETDYKPGFCGGGFIALYLADMLAIQPEVLFTMKGAKYDMGSEDGENFLDIEISDLTLELNYVEIPVLVKILVPVDAKFRPYIFGGPAIGVNLSAKSKYELSGESHEEDLEDVKEMDLGIVAGGGFEFGSLVIEGRYVMGQKSIYDDADDEESDVKNQVITVMAGFSF